MKKLKFYLRPKTIEKEFKKNFLNMRKSMHMFHMKRTTIVLIIATIYFLLEWSARAFNLYLGYPPIDNAIHFAFGLTFAAAAFLIYLKRPKFIMWMILLISIIWELIEVTGDYFVPQMATLLDPFFWDGFKDISVTILGSVVMLLILKRIYKKNYFELH